MKSAHFFGVLVGGTLFAMAAAVLVQNGAFSMKGVIAPPSMPSGAMMMDVPESIVIELDESSFTEDAVGATVAAGGWSSCKPVTRKVRISKIQRVTTKNGEAAALAQATAAVDKVVDASCNDAGKAPQCGPGCTGVPGSARVQFKTASISSVLDKLPIKNSLSVVYRIRSVAGGCDLVRDCKPTGP